MLVLLAAAIAIVDRTPIGPWNISEYQDQITAISLYIFNSGLLFEHTMEQKID